MAEDDSAGTADPRGRLIGAPPRAILLFALRTIAWGIPLFALWFAIAKPFSVATAWTAARMLEVAAPVARANTTWRKDAVAFEVSPDASAIYRARPEPGAVFETEANPLKQTYGIPFLIALLAAARARRFAVKAAAGVAVLFVLAAIGVASEVWIALAPVKGAGGVPIFAPTGFTAVLVALAFQLGTLIVPSVGPIAIWFACEERSRAQGKIGA